MVIGNTDNTTIPDYLKDLKPDKPKLEALVQLARDLVIHTNKIAELEKQLELVKAAKNKLAFQTIPDAMADAGVDHVGLADYGVDVRVVPFYQGTLPKDPYKRQLAVDWLVDNGHGEIIKSTLEALFGRGEHNLAVATKEALANYLAENGHPNIVALNDDVHHMTYKAFIREQSEAGAALPMDVLNAFVGRIAQVEPRKEGKK